MYTIITFRCTLYLVRGRQYTDQALLEQRDERATTFAVLFILVSILSLAVPWGRKIEPGIKRLRMRQILHTFRVNRNLQDTCLVYVASGTSETNA